MSFVPGGPIIGGMGGNIYVGDWGVNYTVFQGLAINPDVNPVSYLEVAQWTINNETLLAECPHTGTWGAISRRTTGYDWSFTCSVPLDQENIPEEVLFLDVNVSLAFYLGDVRINPEAIAMGMTQRFYWSPAATLRRASPILNAAGDVIRTHCMGEGNGLLFIIPDDIEEANDYFNYITQRGWV